MNEDKKFGAFSSSEDPQKLALTVTGAMKAASGAMVFFGILSSTDASTLIEQISILVPLAYSVYGSIEVITGIIRKVVVAFTKRPS